MIYVLIIVIIIILLIMPIEIVFTKDETHNDIDIYLVKLFNLRLDFDEILRYLLTTKDSRDKITIKGLKHNYELYKLSKKLIYDVSKNTRPKKLNLTIKAKKIYPEIDIFIYVFAWYILGYFKNKFHEFVPRIKEEEYEVEYNQKYTFTFKWALKFRTIYLISSIIKNYKDLIKIFKFLRKGKKNYGTSNF